MQVYRISRTEFIRDLDGTGAKTYGGRWNRVGMPVLYTSQAKSLAMLELIVHFASIKAMMLDYSFAVIDIPVNEIAIPENDILSRNFLSINNETLWNITDHFFIEKKKLILRVPSVLIPGEYNYLLNPSFPNYSKLVNLVRIEDAWIDSRYFTRFAESE